MVGPPKSVSGVDELNVAIHGYVPLHRLCASLHVHLTAHITEILRDVAMEGEAVRLVARHCIVVPTKAALAELLLATELMSYLISPGTSALDLLHLICWQLLMQRRLHVPCCNRRFPTRHRSKPALSSPLIH
jgi:hypothetical protein